jgi:hypothetical protein
MKDFDYIKMHGTTIKTRVRFVYACGVNISCIFLIFGNGIFNLLGGLNCVFSVMCAANVSEVSKIHIHIHMLFVAGKVAVELHTDWKESQNFVPVSVSFM